MAADVMDVMFEEEEEEEGGEVEIEAKRWGWGMDGVKLNWVSRYKYLDAMLLTKEAAAIN